MARIAISRRQRLSWLGKPRKLRAGANIKDHDPSVKLGDPLFVREAILEALAQGDYEAVTEIYRAHLRVLNRTRGARTMGVSRQYFHRLLKPSTEPSLPTFVKFMHLLQEEQRGMGKMLAA